MLKYLAAMFCAMAFVACENIDSGASNHSKVNIPTLEKHFFCKNSKAAQAVGEPGTADRLVGSAAEKQALEKLAYRFFGKQANASRWSLYKVKELTMDNAFGRSVVSSSYRLFEGTFLHNGVENKRYALMSKDGTLARSMRSCSEFNELVESLDRGLKSKPDTMVLIRSFLFMTGMLDKQDVVLEKAMALDKRQLESVERQLSHFPSYRFTTPVFQKKDGNILMSFWTWNRVSGLLRRHVLKLDTKGRIIDYIQERLKGKVGQTEKI